MSTTLRPDQTTTKVENSRRIVPIFANLMPVEVVETRRGRQARRGVITGLVVLALVIGGLYALTFLQTTAAEEELVSAQDQAQQLTVQKRQYDEVVRVQNESLQVKEQLTELMASDLGWSTVLSAIRGAAPAGVRLTSVSATVTPEEQAQAAAAEANAGLPSSSTSKPIGTILITGSGPSKPKISSYVDNLAEIPGVADPFLNSVTEEKALGLQFDLRLTLTDEVLGGRFSKSDSKTGGK